MGTNGGTLEGRVTLGETGRGLGGVRLQLINADGQVVRTTSTGPAGRYRFRVPQAGAFTVREITPPLSGPINWFLHATPITLDFSQLQEYEQVASQAGFHPNARPVQPLNSRQLNEVNYNVVLRGPSLTGLDFQIDRRSRA